MIHENCRMYMERKQGEFFNNIIFEWKAMRPIGYNQASNHRVLFLKPGHLHLDFVTSGLLRDFNKSDHIAHLCPEYLVIVNKTCLIIDFGNVFLFFFFKE